MLLQVAKMDGSGDLDWPGEMVQNTKTSPEVTYSCNPLAFDFGMLTGKPRTTSTSGETAAALADDEADANAVEQNSEKKKKKKKHRSKKKSRSASKRHVSAVTSCPAVTMSFNDFVLLCCSDRARSGRSGSHGARRSARRRRR